MNPQNELRQVWGDPEEYIDEHRLAKLVIVSRCFTANAMIAWNPEYVTDITFLSEGETGLWFEASRYTAGWAIAFFRNKICWVHPDIFRILAPKSTTAKSFHESSEQNPNEWNVDVRWKARGYGSLNERDHVGSCLGYATSQISNPEFWNALAKAANQADTFAVGKTTVCVCRRGMHRSRMVAKCLAAWTKGLYVNQREVDHQNRCKEGCQLLTDMQYALNLQQGIRDWMITSSR